MIKNYYQKSPTPPPDFFVEVPWYSGMTAGLPGSISTVARYFCPSARHFIHIAALDPGVKWGPGRMRMELWLSWHVCACKTATGRNAPQGVMKVHSGAELFLNPMTGVIIHCEAL